MAKESGLGDWLAIDGVDLGGDVGSVGSIHGGPAALEVPGIINLAQVRIGGERDGGIDFNSWWNSAAGQSHTTLSPLPLTDRIVSYFHGSTLGNDGASLVAKQGNYDPTRGTDGSLSSTVSCLANGFGLEWGNQVTPGKRSDVTATSPATGFDFTAATSFGWQAYLHVFSFTGTSVTVTLQDSADNVTFAGFTGSAFTAATAIGAQRLQASSSTATVRRYVRAITTGTFSQATFSVLLVKNPQVAVVF